jgi:hypothetical protein
MRLKLLLLLPFLFLFFQTNAQAKKHTAKKQRFQYPESFTITKSDYEKLFSYKTNEVVKNAANKYLDKAVLLLNTQNGDMQLLRLKLSYFAKANLMIQVNGQQSTQLFILSDDKSISYKGKIEAEKITLTKCKQDEIVSE